MNPFIIDQASSSSKSKGSESDNDSVGSLKDFINDSDNEILTQSDPLRSEAGEKLPTQNVPAADNTKLFFDLYPTEPAERAEEFIGRKTELVQEGKSWSIIIRIKYKMTEQ